MPQDYDRLLRESPDEAAACYAFIDAEKADETNPYGDRGAFLCRTLGISRSAYYARRAAEPVRRVRRRAEDLLVSEIRVLHAGSRGAYGALRVHAALVRAGRVVNRKRVERLMRENDIVGPRVAGGGG